MFGRAINARGPTKTSLCITTMEKSPMNDAYRHSRFRRHLPNPRPSRPLSRHYPQAWVAISAFCSSLWLVTSPAFAQVAGGGGNTGLLSQVIGWFVTNIAQGL